MRRHYPKWGVRNVCAGVSIGNLIPVLWLGGGRRHPTAAVRRMLGAERAGRAACPLIFRDGRRFCLACTNLARSGRVASFQRVERQPGRSRQHLMNFMPAPAPPARRPAHAQRPTANDFRARFFAACGGLGVAAPQLCGRFLVGCASRYGFPFLRACGCAVAPAGEAPGLARQVVQRPFERLQPQDKPRRIDRIAGRRRRRNR